MDSADKITFRPKVSPWGITILSSFSERDVKRLNILLKQLTTKVTELDTERFMDIVNHSTLFVARYQDDIVGMTSLCHAITPTGQKWRIEDVVVDESVRGNGLGHQLVSAAIDYVKRNGGGQIELTLRPSRIAANRLYQSMNFTKKETNVYILKL